MTTTPEIATKALQNRPADERPRAREGLSTELVDGEAIVQDAGRGQVTYLNASAAVVWQLCDGQRTEAEMVALLAAAMPEATGIAADVAEAIAGFRRAGLLD